MAREVSPDTILAEFDGPIVEVVDGIRALVRDTVPGVTEHGFLGWRSVAFRHSQAGYICGAFPSDTHVRLIFEQGVHLLDPDGILEGSTKQIRHVTLQPGDKLPLRPLRNLILEAVAYGESRALARKSNRRQ